MKTDIKVSTSKCVLCGEPHDGYRLKIDKAGQQYVICGVKYERVNVKLKDPNSKNPYQPLAWTEDANV